MGTGEKRKTFVHGKRPNVGTEVFPLSTPFLSSIALCKGGSKKAGYFVKQGHYLIGNYLPVQGTEPFKTLQGINKNEYANFQ